MLSLSSPGWKPGPAQTPRYPLGFLLPCAWVVTPQLHRDSFGSIIYSDLGQPKEIWLQQPHVSRCRCTFGMETVPRRTWWACQEGTNPVTTLLWDMHTHSGWRAFLLPGATSLPGFHHLQSEQEHKPGAAGVLFWGTLKVRIISCALRPTAQGSRLALAGLGAPQTPQTPFAQPKLSSYELGRPPGPLEQLTMLNQSISEQPA